MKQVIDNKPNDVVELSYVTPKKFYGVANRVGRAVGFISRLNIEKGYVVFNSDGLTDGNWNPAIYAHYAQELTGLIAILIANNYEVYEFDTSKELYGWLAENTVSED